MENIKNIKYLVEKINLNNLNIKIIKKNIIYLIKIFYKIKNIWNSLENFNYQKSIINKKTNKYNKILDLIKNSYLMNYEIFKYNILNNNNLIKITFQNISVYYFNSDLFKDLEKIINLLKITVCLNKFYLENDKIKRIIIWIPINKNRDFKFNSLNKETLLKSEKNFEAFTVSGITFSNRNKKYTIITRYEEIEKLLLHELVHNFNMDGANYHKDMHEIINNYNLIKPINNYNYEYSIYESYAELLGTYLFLIFKNININNFDDLYTKFYSQIIIEVIYSYNTIVNLAILNKIKSYEEFIKNNTFNGNICIYEYYYLKSLLYNNFEIKIVYTYDDFISIYKNIIKCLENQKNNLLLKDIFLNSVNQINFKYIIN